jgi:hypothetical protein
MVLAAVTVFVLVMASAIVCAASVPMPWDSGSAVSPLLPDARLIGMGYAYVAVWDEPNPLYSNPAAFGLGDKTLTLSLGGGLGNITQEGGLGFVTVTDVEREAGAGGLGWANVRWKAGEEVSSSHTLSYMVGKQFASWGALGVGLKYRMLGGEDFPAIDKERGGLSADVGLVLSYGALSLGVLARDISLDRLEEDEGDVRAPVYSAGASLRAGSRFTVAADVQGIGSTEQEIGNVSCGFEAWITPSLALRAGVSMGPELNLDAADYSGGIGLRGKGYDVSYAVMFSEGVIRTHYFTLKKSL